MIFSAYIKHELKVELVREHRFHPTRKWRFDYALPELKIAIEVEGGVWQQGRHNRASGFLKDMEKYNPATSLRWTLLRITPKDQFKKATVDLIKTTIKNKSYGRE